MEPKIQKLKKGMIIMALQTLLEDAIETGFDKLDMMDVGSDQWNKTAEQLAKMSDRLIEIEKLNLVESNQNVEAKLKTQQQQIDSENKKKELKHEQLDRYIKHGLTAVSVLGGFGLAVWGALASWKYEETGISPTSTAGRKFINNLFFWK